MSDSGDDRETKMLLDELEAKIKNLSALSRASRNVVRTLGTYLFDGGEIPRDLAMAIGGCLVDYIDADGKSGDVDIQLLYEEIERVASLQENPEDS